MIKTQTGLTAEYPATRTNFLVAGYAVRRNLLIQVEVVCNSELYFTLATRYAVRNNLFWNTLNCEFIMEFFMLHFGYAVRSEK